MYIKILPDSVNTTFTFVIETPGVSDTGDDAPNAQTAVFVILIAVALTALVVMVALFIIFGIFRFTTRPCISQNTNLVFRKGTGVEFRSIF